ncbi:MAG: NUDIX pyrophosphatase [Thermoplasmatales archaeon]|nr:MAG: NUDIX pyrophosphatase [Thermoplasmatales archaeon]
MPDVATSILLNSDGKILILKRSDKVKTYKGQWGGVAGYVEKNEKPFDTAIKEIFEEVGLMKEDVKLIKKLDPIFITDYYEQEKYEWKIFVFLFKTKKESKIRIDWEHSEYRWITPSEIINYNTVPHLKDVIKKLIIEDNEEGEN